MEDNPKQKADLLYNSILEKTIDSDLLKINFYTKMLIKELSLFTIDQMISVAPDGIQKLELKKVKEEIEKLKF